MRLTFKGDPSFGAVLRVIDACQRLKSKSDRLMGARTLAGLARQARLSRRVDVVELVSGYIPSLFPDGPALQLSDYYRAYCLDVRGHRAESQSLLASIIADAPTWLLPRAILALGGSHFDDGDRETAIKLYLEAARAARGIDLLTETQALRNLAIAKAIDGDHRGALKELTSLAESTLVLSSEYPSDLGSHLNSVAIELGEIGEVEEANRIIDSLLRNPLANDRPGWHDTKAQLATKPRRVFTPFAIALGAPPEAKSATSTNREHPDPANVASPERARRLPVTQHYIVQVLDQRSSARRKPLRRPNSPFATLFKRLGYSLSPPSRGPPSASSAI